MYPSLEDKTISGAFFKPPIDTLPEKFFYATKDYCVEKEDINESSCNLFISQFNEQQEYDLIIYMSKPEMNIEIDLEARNRQFFSSENYLFFDLYSGKLKLTEQGINLIKNNEQYIEDYLSLWPEDYEIKVIIPNTKEFWGTPDLAEGTYYFTLANKPIKNPVGSEGYLFEENPPLPAYFTFYNIDSKQYETYWTEAENFWGYNEVYKPNQKISCSGVVNLGNKKFTCEPKNIEYNLENLDNKFYISNFSDGIYTIVYNENSFNVYSFDTEPKDTISCFWDGNIFIAQWRGG